jgi:hypothetical protein
VSKNITTLENRLSVFTFLCVDEIYWLLKTSVSVRSCVRRGLEQGPLEFLKSMHDSVM